ncbi:MAG: AAA family ATPase [Verrucomicrobia bacterium]|nr:AAA family ATPase [Verrucomicrobiota bacterium]
MAIVTVCNLDAIYNQDFQYSLPRTILENFQVGLGFGRKEKYTDEEQRALCQDIQGIWNRILEKNPPKEKIAVITAGAPGAGKTMLLETLHLNYAYIDPDAVCLKQMEATYGSEEPNYDKWRAGSNAANHIILGNLIREGIAFRFGTTSSSDQTWRFFKFLKETGYQIHLIHVTAPDSVRWDSIQERDKTFIQTTEEDVRSKGDLVPQRISDTFLKYADQIDFYYRDARDAPATLAATWADKKVTVINEAAYENIWEIHNAICNRLDKNALLWENTVGE